MENETSRSKNQWFLLNYPQECIQFVHSIIHHKTEKSESFYYLIKEYRNDRRRQ
jgi:hypothetical protein